MNCQGSKKVALSLILALVLVAGAVNTAFGDAPWHARNAEPGTHAPADWFQMHSALAQQVTARHHSSDDSPSIHPVDTARIAAHQSESELVPNASLSQRSTPAPFHLYQRPPPA